MSFFKLLNFDCIQIGTRAKDKDGILKEIAVLSRHNEILKDFSEDDIFSALKEREKIGSTGFGNKIAIPHCSFDNLDDFVVGMIVVPEGVDFKSLDGRMTEIFFYIIGPRAKRNKHIRILSSISKQLKDEKIVNNIVKINNKEELIEFLYKIFDDKDLDINHKEKCLLQIFIQNEDYFDDILQLLSSSVEGSISVVETNNAGSYLYSLPLFSGFWSEKHKIFMRIIIAIVDKTMSNDIIRRIHMLGRNTELEPGILITAQDLFYTAGTIDF
jgi:mannitol/fructose-specific phosphotransferase system IIA component (Ntr-type)